MPFQAYPYCWDGKVVALSPELGARIESATAYGLPDGGDREKECLGWLRFGSEGGTLPTLCYSFCAVFMHVRAISKTAILPYAL